MSRSSYFGGSTLIRTGNPQLQLSRTAEKAMKSRIKGYILVTKSGDRHLSVAHGERLLANGSCQLTETWEGYSTIAYKPRKPRKGEDVATSHRE